MWDFEASGLSQHQLNKLAEQENSVESAELIRKNLQRNIYIPVFEFPICPKKYFNVESK